MLCLVRESIPPTPGGGAIESSLQLKQPDGVAQRIGVLVVALQHCHKRFGAQAHALLAAVDLLDRTGFQLEQAVQARRRGIA